MREGGGACQKGWRFVQVSHQMGGGLAVLNEEKHWSDIFVKYTSFSVWLGGETDKSAKQQTPIDFCWRAPVAWRDVSWLNHQYKRYSYMKHVNINVSGENLTTTPMMHFHRKCSVTQTSIFPFVLLYLQLHLCSWMDCDHNNVLVLNVVTLTHAAPCVCAVVNVSHSCSEEQFPGLILSQQCVVVVWASTSAAHMLRYLAGRVYLYTQRETSPIQGLKNNSQGKCQIVNIPTAGSCNSTWLQLGFH